MLLRAFEIQGRSEEEMNLLRTLCNTIILRMIIIQKVWDLIKLTDLENQLSNLYQCLHDCIDYHILLFLQYRVEEIQGEYFSLLSFF